MSLYALSIRTDESTLLPASFFRLNAASACGHTSFKTSVELWRIDIVVFLIGGYVRVVDGDGGEIGIQADRKQIVGCVDCFEMSPFRLSPSLQHLKNLLG